MRSGTDGGSCGKGEQRRRRLRCFEKLNQRYARSRSVEGSDGEAQRRTRRWPVRAGLFPVLINPERPIPTRLAAAAGALPGCCGWLPAEAAAREGLCQRLADAAGIEELHAASLDVTDDADVLLAVPESGLF